MTEVSELLNYTISLAHDHMSHAVDALLLSREYSSSQEPNSARFSHRYAISSIVHSWFGFESVLNYVGFQVFRNEESPRFIPKADRDLPLWRLIDSWGRWLSAIDKFDYLLSVEEVAVDAKLLNELREVSHLRNMVVHGVCFELTLLVERVGESDTYDVVDWESSIDWRERFPNTKFNSVSWLNHRDAFTVLRVVGQALGVLCEAYDEAVVIISFHRGGQVWSIQSPGDLDRLLQSWVGSEGAG
jgi:hypothetical protein